MPVVYRFVSAATAVLVTYLARENTGSRGSESRAESKKSDEEERAIGFTIFQMLDFCVKRKAQSRAVDAAVSTARSLPVKATAKDPVSDKKRARL